MPLRNVRVRPPTGQVAVVVVATFALLSAYWLLPALLDNAPLVVLTAAITAGGLLTLRVRTDGPPTSMLVVPLLVAYALNGADAIGALLLGAMVAYGVRHLAVWSIVGAIAHDVLAFCAAHAVVLAFGLDDVWWKPLAVFAVVFVGVRSTLWRMAAQLKAPPATDPRAERPDALLSLLVVPLVAIPVLGRQFLGDGAVLVLLAAMLTVLGLACESTNLAFARVQLERDRRRMADAAALQEDLISLVAHDIRGPLVAIKLASELGQRSLSRQDFERVNGYLLQTARGGRSIELLVEQLLQFVQLAHGVELPIAEDVKLRPLTDEVVADLATLASARNLRVRVEESGGPVVVHVPRALLRLAISNLVSNAIKYTPEGGEVTIRTQDGSGHGTITVSDTGIGMSSEDLGHVFTKFFRSDDPRVRRERGSGLGLALTHAIAERLGASLTVESELNRGTTFRILIPKVAHAGA